MYIVRGQTTWKEAERKVTLTGNLGDVHVLVSNTQPGIPRFELPKSQSQ